MATQKNQQGLQNGSENSDGLQTSEQQESQSSGGQGDGQATGGEPQAQPLTAGGRTFNSPQEMAAYITQLTTTVREQGRALNDLASRQQQQGVSEGIQPTSRPSVGQGGQPYESDSDLNKRYWDDPVGVLRQEMQRMIAPFQQDLQQSRQMTAVQQLRQEFASYQELEPMIDAMMAQTGQARTYDNLRAAYFMVKGYLAETGALVSPTQNTQQQQVPVNGPPQHRPSNAPVPQPQQGQQRRRALTEDERRIARLGGYTDEQYLALLELDEEEVVNSKIGVPQS